MKRQSLQWSGSFSFLSGVISSKELVLKYRRAETEMSLLKGTPFCKPLQRLWRLCFGCSIVGNRWWWWWRGVENKGFRKKLLILLLSILLIVLWAAESRKLRVELCVLFCWVLRHSLHKSLIENATYKFLNVFYLFSH